MNAVLSFKVLLAHVVCLMLFGARSFGAPANDDFAASVQVSGTNISYSGDRTAATLEPNEPVTGGTNTVWISWAAPGSGPVTTKLPNFTLHWAVYTGHSVGSLQPVTVVPLYANSMCRFWATEGTVYHFQFSGPASAFVFNFQFEPAGVCVNDDLVNAQIVKGNNSNLGPNPVAGATMELGEPAHMGNVPQQSIWWKWQAPQNGTYIFDPNSALVSNVVVGAYFGDAIEALTLIAKETNRAARFPVTGGRTYYLVGAVPAGSTGDIRGSVQRGDIDNASRAVPGNLLLEPSWEGTAIEPQYWGMSGSVGGMHNGYNLGADGITWPTLSQGAKIWQDFAVTAGHHYEVRFAFKSSGAQVKVSWDTNVLGISSIPAPNPNTGPGMLIKLSPATTPPGLLLRISVAVAEAGLTWTRSAWWTCGSRPR